MDKLSMIKVFAKLDRVYIDIDCIEDEVLFCISEYGGVKPYNPITDLALNCAARDKYEVSISHGEVFDCGIDGNGSYDIPVCYVTHCKVTIELMNVNTDDIPHAVIECILKSKGLYE